MSNDKPIEIERDPRDGVHFSAEIDRNLGDRDSEYDPDGRHSVMFRLRVSVDCGIEADSTRIEEGIARLANHLRLILDPQEMNDLGEAILRRQAEMKERGGHRFEIEQTLEG